MNGVDEKNGFISKKKPQMMATSGATTLRMEVSMTYVSYSRMKSFSQLFGISEQLFGISEQLNTKMAPGNWEPPHERNARAIFRGS